MLPFFDRYYSSIHHFKDPSSWLALCSCEADRNKMLDLLDEDNERIFQEAQQCFLDGIQIGSLIARQPTDGL